MEHEKFSHVEQIRTILKQQALRVNIIAQNYFKGATSDQLNEAVDNHRHIKFNNPYSTSKIPGLTLNEIGWSTQKKAWCLYFNLKKCIPVVDIDIQEVLGLLQTLENVMFDQPVENREKELVNQ